MASVVSDTESATTVRFDDPREIRKVPESDLLVDLTQQRDVPAEDITAMGGFDWDLAEVPTVAERTDGVLCVIEGQHRVLLLRSQHPGSEISVCILAGVHNEAAIAERIAKSRRAHSGHALWKLRLNQDRPHQIAAQTVLNDLGLVLSARKIDDPGMIYAVGAINNVIARVSPEEGARLLSLTLSTIKTAFGEQQDMWDSIMIRAVGQLIRRNDNIDTARLANVLRRLTAGEWLKQKINVRKGWPATRCVAAAIMGDYNHHLSEAREIRW